MLKIMNEQTTAANRTAVGKGMSINPIPISAATLQTRETAVRSISRILT